MSFYSASGEVTPTFCGTQRYLQISPSDNYDRPALAPVAARVGEKHDLFPNDKQEVVQERRMLFKRQIRRYPGDRIDHGREAMHIFFSTQWERLCSLIGRIIETVGRFFGYEVTRFQKYHYRSHNEKDEQIYSNDAPLILSENPEPTSYWLGHATLLLNLPVTSQEGSCTTFNVLTDLVEGNLNPLLYRRKTKFALPVEQLPATHIYLLSHNHLDHFDKKAIKKLVPLQPMMVVPHGDARLFTDLGFTNVVELNWWEKQTIELERAGEHYSMTVCATPANHWAGQGPFSGHESSYNGYVIEGCEGGAIYFAGDTARLNDDHITKLRENFDIRWSFQPGGPDEVRADMQSTHQASADALWMHFKLMVARVYVPNMQKALFMDKVNELKTVYMHTMAFKLGNLHLSDTKDSIERILAAAEGDQVELREYETRVLDELSEMAASYQFADGESLSLAEVADIVKATVAVPKIGSRIGLRDSFEPDSCFF